jgi:hypothetical protein
MSDNVEIAAALGHLCKCSHIFCKSLSSGYLVAEPGYIYILSADEVVAEKYYVKGRLEAQFIYQPGKVRLITEFHTHKEFNGRIGSLPHRKSFFVFFYVKDPVKRSVREVRIIVFGYGQSLKSELLSRDAEFFY